MKRFIGYVLYASLQADEKFIQSETFIICYTITCVFWLHEKTLQSLYKYL